MARSEKVSYWRGKHASIPSNGISGRIMMEEDTGDCFLEFNAFNNTTGAWEIVRKQLTDNRKFNVEGGLYTGPVVLAMQPEEAQEIIESNNLGWPVPQIAATKLYVDDVRDNLSTHIDDDSAHIRMHGEITERAYWNNKVDSEAGKGLSQNDFTHVYRSKLDSIAQDSTKTSYTIDPTIENDSIDNLVPLGTISITNSVKTPKNPIPGGATYNPNNPEHYTTSEVVSDYTIYAPKISNISGNAGTSTKLQTARYVDGISFDGTSNITHYTTCGSASSSNVKSVNAENFNELIGASLFIKFANADSSNSTETLQLKVNSYPARDIYYLNQRLSRGKLKANTYHFVVGTGPRYDLVGEMSAQYSIASDSAAGLISAEDKQKLDQMSAKLAEIDEGANNYQLPAATTQSLGGVIIGDNISVDATGEISLTSSDIESALGFMPADVDIDIDDIFSSLDPFEGASEDEDGETGLVPQPLSSTEDYDKYLRGDGTWSEIYVPVFTGPTSEIIEGTTVYHNGVSGSVPAPEWQYAEDSREDVVIGSDADRYLRGDGTWATPPGGTPILLEDIAKLFEITSESDYPAKWQYKLALDISPYFTYNQFHSEVDGSQYDYDPFEEDIALTLNSNQLYKCYIYFDGDGTYFEGYAIFELNNSITFEYDPNNIPYIKFFDSGNPANENMTIHLSSDINDTYVFYYHTYEDSSNIAPTD